MAQVPKGPRRIAWAAPRQFRAGRLLPDLPLTLFSVYDLVALSGVVVNDSIVLIGFINRRLADCLPLEAALLDADRRRFRPVVLTSVTTIAGMLPILPETKRQILVQIPMATSLAFALMLATVLVDSGTHFLSCQPTNLRLRPNSRTAAVASPRRQTNLIVQMAWCQDPRILVC